MDFRRKSLLAAALIAAPMTVAHAAGSNVDLYYVGVSELETDGAPAGDFSFDDGDGYGAKARFNINDLFFVSGEYQNVEYGELEYDDGNPLTLGTLGIERELETWRAGLGFQFAETPFYILGEYIGLESELSTDGNEQDEEQLGEDIDESGYGAHLGAKGNVNEALSLNAQIGYVDIGDNSGLEYLVGVGFNFTPAFGLFADYRYTSLDGDDNNVDLNLSDARVGLRLNF